MNSAFQDILAANEVDRRDLFLTTANRIGTTLQNIEKDFWVCWTLWALFQELGGQGPRLLFKGGTSLSKAYGLISRFSEDIDITVFREDIGQNIEVIDLEGLSGKKQRVHLESIKNACQTYISSSLKDRLNRQVESAFKEAGVSLAEPPVVHDP